MRRALVIAGLLLAASSANAQDNRAESDRLFNEGIALYGKKDFEGARGKFADAYAKFPSPNALFNLARTEQLLGRCSLALPHYRAYVALPENPRITAQNRIEAKQRTEECNKTIGRVQIHAPPAVNVSVDGRPMPWEPGDVLEIVPGAHVVNLQMGADSKRRETQCDAGQVVTISWDDEKVIVSGGGGTPEPKTRTVTSAVPPTPTIVFLGLGAASLGLGIGFALDSQSKQSTGEKTGPCAGPGDPSCAAVESMRSAQATSAALSIAFYIGAGVLAATGIVWWIVAPRKTIEVIPTVSPTGAGILFNAHF